MAMQERLDSVKKYLQVINYMLSYVRTTEELLSNIAYDNKNNMNYEIDGRNQLFIVKKDKLVFVIDKDSKEGNIAIELKKGYKRLPKDVNYIGKNSKSNSQYDYIDLDDLLYIVHNLKEFRNICIEKILKENDEVLNQYIDEIKESAVADLL